MFPFLCVSGFGGVRPGDDTRICCGIVDIFLVVKRVLLWCCRCGGDGSSGVSSDSAHST